MRGVAVAVVLPLLLGAAPTPMAPSISVDQAAPALGDVVTFTTTVPPMPGWQYPMVAVSCYQDVNGDGVVDTALLGPDIVYSWLDRPSAPVTLGGYSSIWTLRGGGPASCRADLDAYGWKGGRQYVRVLDSISFTAEG